MARELTTVLEVQSVDGRLLRVQADAYGLHCVEQCFDKDGNPVLDEGQPRFKTMARAHYGTLRGAVLRLFDEGLRAGDAFQVNALLFRMEEWVKRLEAAIAEKR